ncbi:MAG TPA: malonyl-CoA synthase, partial [Chromatiaceae bacterium]|nr:malonyl-CoA synthase [Chromatiaceae bacterium]
MSNANLYALFRDRFPNDPNALFLDAADAGRLHYAEVSEQTAQMVALLRQLGVQKADRVVVQVDKSIHAVMLYLACLRAGAIFIPLNTAYTASEVGYFLRDSMPRLFVCASAKQAELAALAADCQVPKVLSMDADGGGEWLDQARALPAYEPIAELDGDDLAAILYTSGTTGRSKGAMLSHANLATNAQVLFEHWHWQQDDVLLHALPIFHVHGLFVALHCALLGGSRVLFMPRFDTDQVIANLTRATVMMGVPTFYTRLLEHGDFQPDLCAHMRLFISGSAPLPAAIHAEFERRSGHRILERYGMTEAGMITSNPVDGKRIAGTVGFPLPGISARVADEQGKVLPAGQTGVLEITGPNVFKG